MQKRSAYYAALNNDVEYLHERNDCSVRAMAIAADITYAQSHLLHKNNGRKDRRGSSFATIASVAEALDMKKTMQGKITLKRFISENPKGAFYVVRRGHAFAVINGIVYDWQRGTSELSRVILTYSKGQ